MSSLSRTMLERTECWERKAVMTIACSPHAVLDSSSLVSATEVTHAQPRNPASSASILMVIRAEVRSTSSTDSAKEVIRTEARTPSTQSDKSQRMGGTLKNSVLLCGPECDGLDLSLSCQMMLTLHVEAKIRSQTRQSPCQQTGPKK